MAWNYTAIPYGGASKSLNSSGTIAGNASGFGFGSYNGEDVKHMGAAGAGKLVEGGVAHGLNEQEAGISAEQLNQQAGIDLTKGHQSGAFGVLNTLLSQGYIDQATLDKALGHYKGVQNSLGAGREQFNQAFDPAMQQALDISKTGGISDADFDALMGEYGALKGRYNQAADTGNMTKEEYEQNLASRRQDMMDMGRSNAEATFNKANASGSPWQATALLAQNARDTGVSMANERSALDKYQADSRERARDSIRETLGQEGDTRMKRADNKLGGVNASNDLIGSLGSFIDNMLGVEGSLAGEMAGLETKIAPAGNQSIVDSLLEDLGQMVDIEGNKKGGSTAKTPYSTSTTSKGKNSVSNPTKKKSGSGGFRIG